VNETYTVDALSFTEAEKRIMEEMSSYISGEFTVKDIKIAPYKEIFLVMTLLPTVGIRLNCSLLP
jgi:hypothetical protein